MMKYISLSLIIILLSCGSAYKKAAIQMPSVLFEIDFQDYFRGDSISLKINECLVFENEILYSDSLLGNAYVVIKGYSYDNSRCEIKGYRHDSGYEVIFVDKKISCKMKGNLLNIKIIMNAKKEWSFQVDLNKGKFIGFSKFVGLSEGEEDRGLRLLQSVIPFGYD